MEQYDLTEQEFSCLQRFFPGVQSMNISKIEKMINVCGILFARIETLC